MMLDENSSMLMHFLLDICHGMCYKGEADCSVLASERSAGTVTNGHAGSISATGPLAHCPELAAMAGSNARRGSRLQPAD